MHLRPSPSLLLLVFTISAAGCAGRVDVRTTADDPSRVDVSELWVEPGDMTSRDLFAGPGGLALGPPSSAAFAFVKEDTTGFSRGYDVRDSDGIEWSVKLGPEAETEVAMSRILWGLGFHQPAIYMVESWRLEGAESANGTQPKGRFRREAPEEHVVGEWSWYENPFAHTQAFKGLVVVNVLLNNWDWKTSNNKIYDVLDASGFGERYYIVRDLGASLGKTSFPQMLRWTPLRAMAQGSRNELEDFEEQGFITKVEGVTPHFDYRGIHQRLVNTLTVADVVWACRLMDRLSDQQLRDAFRAAGYDDEHQRRYVAKIRSKIREGLALQDSSEGRIATVNGAPQ